MIELPSRYAPTGAFERGGSGDVLFCTDDHLERTVAIKILQESQETRRLLDELKALLLMRSKHVVQVYDIIPNKDGLIGIVEEFVCGEDLWDSEKPRRSTESYLLILWQIAAGIASIHDSGLIHRDIKPNNMKLDKEDVVKIFDFGLARNEGTEAKTLGFVGTHGFAAPELYGTGTVVFSKEVDVYAFGMTAIHLALGVLPCDAQTNVGVYDGSKIVIPSSIKSLLLKCIDNNPLSRPSMELIKKEIGRFLLKDKHQAIVVHSGSPSYLNAKNRHVRLKFGTVGAFAISYDGLYFKVSETENEVFINNSPATVGMELPGSCVVALGSRDRRASNRAFVTFDISNPEVVI